MAAIVVEWVTCVPIYTLPIHGPMKLYPALICLLVLIAGCGSQTDTPTDTLQNVTVQLNWFPETEHGGLFQALADGSYEAAELAVTLRPGGPGTQTGVEVGTQRAQFAIANADDVALYRQGGLDVVAVMAAMQNHPRCVIAHAESGVESFDDLQGKIFQCQAGRSYVEFMRAKGFLEGVQEVPYSGSIAPFLANQQMVVQGYSCAEPLLAEQRGVKVKTLMVSDLGFNPYSSVLITSGELIRTDPELVRQVVRLTRQGWQGYLQDPAQANAAILKANEEAMTPEVLEFGAGVMKELATPEGTSIDQVGKMEPQRWETLVQQLADLELVDPQQVKPEDCYTLEFLE